MIGATLTLRPPVPEDVEQRLALGNAPEIMRMFGADPSKVPPLTREAAKSFLDRLAIHPHAWSIEHDGCFVGEIRLDGVDQDSKHARLAVGLYDIQKLGQGLGREAVGLVLVHAFGALRLRRVTLRVVAYNGRAIRCYRACGFVDKAREPNAVEMEGIWYDDIIMEISADRFAEISSARQAS
jgi:RimJ/RimL family protein N-acetyltransferase